MVHSPILNVRKGVRELRVISVVLQVRERDGHGVGILRFDERAWMAPPHLIERQDLNAQWAFECWILSPSEVRLIEPIRRLGARCERLRKGRRDGCVDRGDMDERPLKHVVHRRARWSRSGSRTVAAGMFAREHDD
jgi:hypothetical protein